MPRNQMEMLKAAVSSVLSDALNFLLGVLGGVAMALAIVLISVVSGGNIVMFASEIGHVLRTVPWLFWAAALLVVGNIIMFACDKRFVYGGTIRRLRRIGRKLARPGPARAGTLRDKSVKMIRACFARKIKEKRKEAEGFVGRLLKQAQGFTAHLVELQERVVMILFALLMGFVAMIPFRNKIYDMLSSPLRDHLSGDGALIAVGVVSPFFIPMGAAFFFAACGMIPFVLHVLWGFVAPGLYENEQKLARRLVISSVMLFFTGVVFAYFVVFGLVFGFIAVVTPDAVNWTPDIGEFFGFMLWLFFLFGLAFEIPVAQFILVRAGIVTVAKLKKARRWVIVGVFVVAAIVTPPDVVSQLLLAIPCCLLYEAGLWVVEVPRPIRKLFYPVRKRVRRKRFAKQRAAREKAGERAGSAVVERG